MYHRTRDEELAFMKRLWRQEPTPCPVCGEAELQRLHKRPKKGKMNNNDWVCPACGEIYRTINMMYDLPEK